VDRICRPASLFAVRPLLCLLSRSPAVARLLLRLPHPYASVVALIVAEDFACRFVESALKAALALVILGAVTLSVPHLLLAAGILMLAFIALISEVARLPLQI